MENDSNFVTLNGSDWEAQYFLSDEQFYDWSGRPRRLENMLMDSARSSGFLSGAEAPGALKGTVPGCDRTFLLENQQIEEPYYGRNLERSVWAEKAAWSFRKRFTVPKQWLGRRIRIDFAGIDYEATFFLNGVYLGTHRGAFVPCGWDITEWVKFGEENLIAVSFLPAPQGGSNHYDHVPADFAKYHRTQLGFGWDWSRKFVPTGIWDDVILSSYEKVRLKDWHTSFSGELVSLSLAIESRFEEKRLPLEVALVPPKGQGKEVILKKSLSLRGGHNEAEFQLQVPGLRRWMPNGLGEPFLYELKICLAGEEVVRREVGFKEVSMKRNPDAPEDAHPLLFVINGQEIFINGVNWVPPDLMPSRLTAEDYQFLVAQAANAGINLFRMWGGGQLEKDSFYEACDRHGILVWHEFYHACSNSPKNDSEYVAFKEREARSVLRRLRRHVCLSLVCGGNEMQYYGEIPDAPLLKMYGEVAKEMTPGLPYHVSSPDLSRPGERPHGPWNFQEHSSYNAHFRQLASEYGCNAMPVYESLRRFIPEAECQAREGQSLQYHFLNPARLRPVYAFDVQLQKFKVETTEQFCNATLLAQADVALYMTEHYRRLFPASSGSIFWQYNEPWPTCAWSIVDYYGVPKQALHALKQASAPVLLSLKDNSWCIPDGVLQAEWNCTVAPHATSDRTVEARLSLWTAAGQLLLQKRKRLALTAGTQTLLRLKEKVPGGDVLVVRMEIPGIASATRLYGSPDFTAFFSRSAEVSIVQEKNDAYRVENKGKHCALCVRLATLKGAPDTANAFFSDDYLTLLPGEIRRVSLIRKGK